MFDLGRPGAPGPAEVVITHEGEAELARLEASPAGFRRHTLDLPADHDREVVFDSGTFVPGAGDERSLGVAVSRLHMADATWEPRRWAGERFPWLLRDPSDLEFLNHYDRVLANSGTPGPGSGGLWGVDSDVLFPPIRPGTCTRGTKTGGS